MAEMTQADLYLQMWRATKDPKYIRLFREAMTAQVSRRVENAEGAPMKWEDAHIDSKTQRNNTDPVPSWQGMTYLEMTRRNLIALGIATPQQLPPFPDGKTYTLEEILEELK
jgi:hypothetical protein